MSVAEHDVAMLGLVGPIAISVAEKLVGHDSLKALLEDGRVVPVAGAGSASARVVVATEPVATPNPLERLTQVRDVVARLTGIGSSPMVDPEVALALSRVLIDAGDTDGPLFEQAARHALVVGEPVLARDLAAASLADDPGRSAAAHLLAMSLEARGQHGAAAAVGSGSRAEDSAWLGRWSSNLFVSTGIATNVPPVPDDRNELVANRIWIDALDGAVGSVATSVRMVLDDPRSSPQAIVWACVGGSLPAALDGRSRVARRLLQHAASVTGFQPDELSPFTELQIGLATFLVDVRTGDVAAAERTVAGIIDTPTSPFLASVWTTVGGLSARERGAYDEGISRFERGLAELDDVPFGLGDWARSELAVCRAMVGHGASTTDDPDSGFGLFRSCLHRNNAWIAAANGRLGDAQQSLQRAIGAAVDRGQVGHQALAIIDVARFGKRQFAETLLLSLPDRDAAVVDLCAGAVGALAAGALDDLIESHRRARRLGFEPFASELAAAALDVASRRSPELLARTELMVTMTVTMTIAAGATSSPMLDELAPTQRIVTSRERQIAELAGSSMSSAAIAEQLGISVRTVDNLLGRVYSKAGLSGRAELESLYGRRVEGSA